MAAIAFGLGKRGRLVLVLSDWPNELSLLKPASFSFLRLARGFCSLSYNSSSNQTPLLLHVAQRVHTFYETLYFSSGRDNTIA